MRLLDTKQLYQLLHEYVNIGKAFSLIRLGDGEFITMRFPKYADIKLCKARIDRWIDSNELDLKSIFNIANLIRGACLNSDILGVPSNRERTYPKWKEFSKYSEEINLLPGKQLFHFYIIGDFYKQGYLDKLINSHGVDKVIFITCWDLKDKLQQKYNKQIELIRIPRERFRWHGKITKEPDFHLQNDNDIRANHYASLYSYIYNYTHSKDLKRNLFFIGAGGLGKIYCDWVKKNNGMAIDIGALFDGWAGEPTRPYLQKTIGEYTL